MMATVLVCENDASGRRLLEVAFERAGFQTVGVSSAPTAIEVLARREISAVVSDVLLDVGNGFDVLGHASGVPFLLITGYATYGMRCLARASGAIDVWQKPVSMAEVVEAVTGRVVECGV